jgi:RluA family pseudouridine synthase
MAQPDFEILFENGDVLVVNKPAGLSTQAPRGIDSLELRVRAWLQASVNADMVYWQCDPSGQAPAVYLGLPHRLDRPVSGAIVMAKTKKAARKISRQFEHRRVRKTYWAAVEGIVEPAAGTWADSLRKVPGEARAELVAAEHPGAQHAILHYRTLQQVSCGSWLEIELETGRMHQIRLQAASRGWPILGDAHYGSKMEFGDAGEELSSRAIALHARSLTFTLPLESQPRTFVAPTGPSWQKLGITGAAELEAN